MAKWRYTGPGPHDDGDGGLIRPGDVHDFPSEPPYGPFVPVDGAESPAEPPAAPAPTPAPAPAPPPPAAAPPAPPTAATPAAGPEGM